MKITIYSRNSIECLLQKNFPQNTIVISFYDPDKYNNEKTMYLLIIMVKRIIASTFRLMIFRLDLHKLVK